MLRSEDYRTERQEIAGQPIMVTSYRIGDRFYCHIDNVDPGATIARADAPTREEAVGHAVAKAASRIDPARGGGDRR